MDSARDPPFQPGQERSSAMGADAAAEEAARRLAERLRSRRAEIAPAITTRVYALADQRVHDPEYLEGLRSTLSVGLDYALAAIELVGRQPPAVPTALLAQARLAARHGVGLDVVLRRYFAAYSLLADFAMEEAQSGDRLSPPELQTILRSFSMVFDHLVAAITEEYAREGGRTASMEERRAERVRRLLAGELLDGSDLNYDLSGWHIGAVATGLDLATLFRGVAASLDRSLLLVRTGELSWAAWIGGQHKLDGYQVESRLAADWPEGVPLAVGEPGMGLSGWRLTHRQASAALPLATRPMPRYAFYAEVALHASAIQDDLLSTSLRQLYMDPLEEERDAEVLRETLRAYLQCEQNISSAAAALGVSRRTISNRLRRVEARLDRRLHSIVAELEVALRLRDIEAGAAA